MEQILDVVVYVGVGIIAMMIGYALIDLIIPVNFPKEIKEGNRAVGWLSAGIYTGLGFIIRGAIITLSAANEHRGFLEGLKDTVIYVALGLVFFMVGYFLIDLVNRRFNFNEEIARGNEAAGIMVFGIFLGIALIVSGVIQ